MGGLERAPHAPRLCGATQGTWGAPRSLPASARPRKMPDAAPWKVLGLVIVLVLAGGCAVPGWVPLIGKSSKAEPPSSVATGPAAGESKPIGSAPVEAPRVSLDDDAVTDRVVAVVNNDAITLMEVQESIVAAKQENRGQMPSDEDLAKEFLSRLIDMRLQLQEADREKIIVEDAEVDDELSARLKKLPGNPTRQDFEEAMKAQGLAVESVKRRIREGLRLSKVVRRKVTLRVSVNDQEIDQYLEQNRGKLEQGLPYHARNILIVPEGGGAEDAAWEAARIRANLIRQQIVAGADFAETARSASRDASAKDGGDLGTLKRGELAADIENEILKLAPGEVSQPYRSPLGYHLFKLESKETLEGQGQERARQQIRDILFREKYEARLNAWLKEIKQRAIIEVRL
jgi:peptidyl-prolyl cis-trans isomerase SurA